MSDSSDEITRCVNLWEQTAEKINRMDPYRYSILEHSGNRGVIGGRWVVTKPLFILAFRIIRNIIGSDKPPGLYQLYLILIQYSFFLAMTRSDPPLLTQVKSVMQLSHWKMKVDTTLNNF